MKKRNKPTIEEVRRLGQPPDVLVRDVEGIFGPINRKFSLRVSWFLLHFSFISPNMVTVFHVLLGLFGGLLILLPGFWGPAAFVFVYLLWKNLDAVDGEMARYLNRRSYSGPFIDSLGYLLVYLGTFVSIGLKAHQSTGNQNFIYLGIATAVLIVLSISAQYIREATLFEQGFSPEQEEAGESKKSWLVETYRSLIYPIEVSFIVVAIIIVSNYYGYLEEKMWYIFFIAYGSVFLASVLYNTINGKLDLDKKQKFLK